MQNQFRKNGVAILGIAELVLIIEVYSREDAFQRLVLLFQCFASFVERVAEVF